LNVVANGTAPFSYQWRKSGVPISGATTASFTITNAQGSDSGTFSVVVSNAGGSVTSTAATLTVQPPPVPLPVISTPPIAQSVQSGTRATFNVVAASPVPVSYQWFKDGVEIEGATSAVFNLEAAHPIDAGRYFVRVVNSAGAVTTPAVELAVKFSRLINLSTRAFVPPGGALTPGFYLRGPAPKPLLVRAVGPTLALFGVGGALVDAKLDVIAQTSSAIIASNAGWGGTPTLRTVFTSVGAFPLAADSKDAAIATTLPPAAYSVRVTTADGASSGVTLAEIYDTDTASTSVSQLVNLSALGFVGTGENALTAGFAINGNAPKRLLIRAVGPGLAPFGVADLLPNPQIGVVPSGAAEPIAINDDWVDLPETRALFIGAGAFSLVAGSRDAILVLTLPPGAYTVIVSGASGSATGNALVEIYDLDP
jgi:hypothetical protein